MNLNHPIRIGCAGWALSKEHQDKFPAEGTHLQRYASIFSMVEINSSFYRPHKFSTYERWAGSVSDDFRFAVKIPKEITHVLRLRNVEEPLKKFLSEVAGLGKKCGPLLIQLPPGLKFMEKNVEKFFSLMRDNYDGEAACEPRHATWFSSESNELLRNFQVARVAADPALIPEAADPDGWRGLSYIRWHGSPKMYYSAYSSDQLSELSVQLKQDANSGNVYCVFDNTARGAAIPNALEVKRIISSSPL